MREPYPTDSLAALVERALSCAEAEAGVDGSDHGDDVKDAKAYAKRLAEGGAVLLAMQSEMPRVTEDALILAALLNLEAPAESFELDEDAAAVMRKLAKAGERGAFDLAKFIFVANARSESAMPPSLCKFAADCLNGSLRRPESLKGRPKDQYALRNIIVLGILRALREHWPNLSDGKNAATKEDGTSRYEIIADACGAAGIPLSYEQVRGIDRKERDYDFADVVAHPDRKKLSIAVKSVILGR